ncbi:unnamed protein product [Peronospora farinosa]|uniref:Uncharacterized protein n=1 Tax=Peronospora farinosa TaxID=134698 RepID=A0ABN8CKM9_9STRA|nr:unnamed protein product [Peronospora farinosa]
MPKDRMRNRYLVNFVDHKSNYCRVFLARNKQRKISSTSCRSLKSVSIDGFMSFKLKVEVSTRMWTCFCKSSDVARQISEARNQASNGKAECMHRTVLNMARAMIFASDLPLYFGGDAVKYSTYILNFL